MKKLFGSLIALICVVVCLLTLPIEADAATSGYYTYSVSNSEATITGVSTSISGAITIPSTLGGYPVASIGDDAFFKCTRLTSVTIPDSVTSIGDYAFAWCSGLTSITIPDSVTSIDNAAFYHCSSLTSVTIPDSVTSIGHDAFDSCSSLTSVTIPDHVTSIGNAAFLWCSSLTSVTIPDSVTSIGHDAFYNCTSLKSVTIGDGVTSIGYNTFYDCTSLKSVTIGDGVTSIGSSAFRSCSSLTSVTIPDSVTSIDSYAFDSCSSLTSVTIPDSVTSIGNNAFYNCTSLKSVTIGDGVTSIDSYAFDSCSSLTGIWVDEKNQFYSSDNSGVLFNKDKTTLLHTPGAISGSYTIPDSVTGIGEYAFCNCDGLTSITIPNNVITIGDYTFYDCDGLSSITISNSVTSIGNSAFYYCTSLTSVTISDSVTTIGNRAFYKCTGLTDVYYTGTQEQWDAISIGSYNDSLLSANLTIAYIPPHKCEYTVWEQIVCPSFTATGMWKKTCPICGDTVTEAVDMLVGEVSGWNVTICDDLQVNFHLNISQSIENTARVRIVVGEEGYTFRVSGLEKTKDGLYIASVHIAAAQMTDFIFVTVINGSDLAETASYTVRGYADTILADEDYSQYHQLVREMLNYGAAAQVYFDYEKDNLANEGITNTGAAEIPDSVDSALSVTGNAEGVTFYGASLIFRNKIAVRYYFQFIGNINDCSFTVNDATYAPQLKDGLYYVEIADILPQDLDQQVTLTVTDENGSTLTVAYSPMNYIVRMSEKGSAALQNLVKALYNYHLAAKALSA